MRKDAYDVAREYLDRGTVIQVINWALDRGLRATHYNPVFDEFQFNDGEIFTTRRLLVEVENDC